MAAHEQAVGATDEWCTPPYVFDAMGVRFDMDVAHPGAGHARWVPAEHYMTHGSLERPWSGFVWMNPPFGKRMGLVPWLRKFFDHGDGVALTPDRTACPWWQDFAPLADQILFVRGKIKFIRPDGTEGKQPGMGTTLLAAGPRGVEALRNASQAGLGFCPVGREPISPTEGRAGNPATDEPNSILHLPRTDPPIDQTQEPEGTRG